MIEVFREDKKRIVQYPDGTYNLYEFSPFGHIFKASTEDLVNLLIAVETVLKDTGVSNYPLIFDHMTINDMEKTVVTLMAKIQEIKGGMVEDEEGSD